MVKWLTLSLIAALASTPAAAREQIRMVGSSTVFPFAAAAAEQFGRSTTFRTPIVEANGTGGGFKMFCDGIGDHYPDIANASRPIKPSETEQCAKHGITDITELKIGYDGIVIANALKSPAYKLSRKAIFLALARDVPKNGKLIPNPYENWQEIDPALPDSPIEIYGPPPAEGTRDAFIELVMEEGCKEIPAYKTTYPDDKTRKAQCGTVREDGKFVELLGGNVMVQKLVNNETALGIFSYSFLDQNRGLVKANEIETVLPTTEHIISGKYSAARSLFIYIKNAHIGKTRGLAEFSRFMVSNDAISEDGFLSIKGLIPLATPERTAMQEKVKGL